jgi:hypothetical protein
VADGPVAVTTQLALPQCDDPSPPPRQRNVRRSRKSIPPAPIAPSGFDRFWQAYPATSRRANRAKCLARWIADDLEDRADQIVAHVERCCHSDEWQRGFEPMTTTYLNERRYESPAPAPAAGPRAQRNGHHRVVATYGGGALPEGREDR